ncbi:hypothetical protein OQA88_185 [Cercophora sp. LCS_1]
MCQHKDSHPDAPVPPCRCASVAPGSEPASPAPAPAPGGCPPVRWGDNSHMGDHEDEKVDSSSEDEAMNEDDPGDVDEEEADENAMDQEQQFKLLHLLDEKKKREEDHRHQAQRMRELQARHEARSAQLAHFRALLRAVLALSRCSRRRCGCLSPHRYM